MPIPEEVLDYLASDDALLKVQLTGRNPELESSLKDPQTRAAVLEWLRSSEAWEESAVGLTMNCIVYLQNNLENRAAETIRIFTLHDNSRVRLAASEFLLALYFSKENREAIVQLLQNMLSDDADTVRCQAARYLQRTGTGAELNEFLERWHGLAQRRGWAGTGSFELVERLLEQ